MGKVRFTGKPAWIVLFLVSLLVLVVLLPVAACKRRPGPKPVAPPTCVPNCVAPPTPVALPTPVAPPPTKPPIIFNLPPPATGDELPTAYLGEPYFYCFCSPREMAWILCGGINSLPDNPTGGSGPPSEFQSERLSESLPWGLRLDGNGCLDGTPDPRTARVDVYNLEICAIDSSRSFVCKKVKLTVEGVRVQQWELIFQFPGLPNYVHSLQVYPDGAFTGTRQNPQELPYCKVDPYMLVGKFSGDQVSFSGAVKQTCLVSGVERELHIVDSANGQANFPFPDATRASGSGTAETWDLSGETQSGWTGVQPMTLSFSWVARRIDTPGQQTSITTPTLDSNKRYARITNQVAEVNLRATPGYIDKNDLTDVVVRIPQGELVEIIGGPEEKDGLTWWNITWNGYIGWIADHTGSGREIMDFSP